MIRRPPRSTQSRSSAASDVYKRQPRLRAMWLIVLLTWVTRSLPAICGLRGWLAGDEEPDGHAPTRGDLLRGRETAQGLDRGANDVHRVRGAVDLRKDVADAGGLHHRADGAAGDDARPLRGGLEQHPGGRELGADLVRDGGPHGRDSDEVLLRVLDALADGLGHLAGLAEPGADVAVAVTDDDDRGEAEASPALDDLGDAVDLDDTLFERELGGIDPGHWRSSPP